MHWFMHEKFLFKDIKFQADFFTVYNINLESSDNS